VSGLVAQLANCFDLSRALQRRRTQNKTPLRRREQSANTRDTSRFSPAANDKVNFTMYWATLFALAVN